MPFFKAFNRRPFRDNKEIKELKKSLKYEAESYIYSANSNLYRRLYRLIISTLYIYYIRKRLIISKAENCVNKLRLSFYAEEFIRFIYAQQGDRGINL